MVRQKENQSLKSIPAQTCSIKEEKLIYEAKHPSVSGDDQEGTELKNSVHHETEYVVFFLGVSKD